MHSVSLKVGGEVIGGDVLAVRLPETPTPAGWVPAQELLGGGFGKPGHRRDVMISQADYEGLVHWCRNDDPACDIDVALEQQVARTAMQVTRSVYARRVRDLAASFDGPLHDNLVAAGWFGIALEPGEFANLRRDALGMIRIEDLARSGGFSAWDIPPARKTRPILMLLNDEADDVAAAWALDLLREVHQAIKPYWGHREAPTGLELVSLVAANVG